MTTPPTTAIGSSLDSLLDAASEAGARLTWGRSWLTHRYWVALHSPNGRVRTRRARTLADAARRLLRDIDPGAKR